ncbi:unnamed protein product [Bursaphelenchus okinawaensis]|uniref:Afadin n=1 Tax=Bursaphelenchus okinawaensis TaxID=465554 RepID=A0A811JVH8_9BILA|nr:unnamed protein product [Bursaphelenchus okinawaensis]CAG9084472.1 unnamed protein product [Bursaphelenchus okinawaensis]
MEVDQRERLRTLIRQWNENRLDLFSISEPNENMEFYGVMRFYYQEPGQKVTTKCIRVSSSATTKVVIEALVEKFHPDMKMLTEPDYSIWELHENKEERMLAMDERPLLVQLSWHQTNREGRFLLRSTDEPEYLPFSALQFGDEVRSSKRSNKFKKRIKEKNSNYSDDMNKCLYEELPENTFTRTISNPEVVMKRQREQKIDQKLKELGEMGLTGGSLKIYCEELDANRPYVSVLVSPLDHVEKVLQEAVEKFSFGTLDYKSFVIVEVQQINGQRSERSLLFDECPVVVLAQNNSTGIETSFHLRKRTSSPPTTSTPLNGKESTMLTDPPPSYRQATHFDVAPETIQSNIPNYVQLRCSASQFLTGLFENFRGHEAEFPLAPAFATYLAVKDPHNREALILLFCNKVNDYVQSRPDDWRIQNFWLANCLELTNVLSKDANQRATNNLNEHLKVTTIRCFDFLVESCRIEVERRMSKFLNITVRGDFAVREILDFLEDVSNNVRSVQMNAGLIIQLFSHIFYTINMYAFNWLISTEEGNSSLTRQFATQFRARISELTRWAEVHGLELVADCQLDRINQTLLLLVTPKTVNQIASLGATCYKLNSLQVRFLLSMYISEPNEVPVTQVLVDNVVQLAERQADIIVKEEGGDVVLKEDPVMRLPFSFPEDGYVLDTLESIPLVLSTLLNNLQRLGFCDLIYEQSQASWPSQFNHQLPPIHRQPPPHYRPPSQTLSFANRPDRITVTIRRPVGTGLGLSIVAAQGVGDQHMGIYIKKVVENSPAFLDRSLARGDQILAVNGMPLLNVSQEIAAKHISAAGPIVRLDVLKNQAAFNGLDSWLDSRSQVQQAQNNAQIYATTSDIHSHVGSYSQNSLPSVSSQRLPERFRPVARPPVMKPHYQQLAHPDHQLHQLNDHHGFIRRGSVGSLKVIQNDVRIPQPPPESGRRSAPIFERPEEVDRKPSLGYIPLTNGTSRLVHRQPPVVNEVARSHEACLNELNKEFEKRISFNSNHSNNSRKLYPHNKNDDDFVRQVDLLQEQANRLVYDDEGRESSHHEFQPRKQSLKENRAIPPQDRLLYELEDDVNNVKCVENEPRVQILGSSEVYNDPRQRRLNQINESQNAQKTGSRDGSQLDFRDKMRLFASQLGEDDLRAKFKASSAEREIEESA